MTDLEILEKAIKKTIDGGWLGPKPRIVKLIRAKYAFHNHIDLVWEETNEQGYTVRVSGYRSPNDIIFSHDFAKALWGENNMADVLNGKTSQLNYGWKTHLERMVIADDPIKYLGENI